MVEVGERGRVVPMGDLLGGRLLLTDPAKEYIP